MPRPDRVIEPIEDDFDSVVSNAAQPLRKNKRKQTQRNEGLTEQWVNHTLHDLGYFKNETLIVEPKKSEKPQIQKLLSNATKKLGGIGAGFPDYIIRDTRQENIVVVIECKADITKHISLTFNDNHYIFLPGISNNIVREPCAYATKLFCGIRKKFLDLRFFGLFGFNNKRLIFKITQIVQGMIHPLLC